MKRLLLLRHAKSGWDDPVSRDFDRPLNDKGRRAARTVGRHMRDAGLVFDHLVASPARRVAETLDEVGAGYGRRLAPAYDTRLYLAAVPTLLDVVQDSDDRHGTLLLVGHNPGLEELVLALVPDDAGPRADVVEKYPTASLAEILFDVDRWADVAPGTGRLTRFVRPRDLDPALGPDPVR